MLINERMDRFRRASRETFNNYFRVPREGSNIMSCQDECWGAKERFDELERVMFEKLVKEPLSIEGPEYGLAQPNIQVVSENLVTEIPIMLNRELASGYWDYPLKGVPAETVMRFVCYFDFDCIDNFDCRYVRIEVEASSKHPEIVGKEALIETQYISYKQVVPPVVYLKLE